MRSGTWFAPSTAWPKSWRPAADRLKPPAAISALPMPSLTGAGVRWRPYWRAFPRGRSPDLFGSDVSGGFSRRSARGLRALVAARRSHGYDHQPDGDVGAAHV